MGAAQCPRQGPLGGQGGAVTGGVETGGGSWGSGAPTVGVRAQSGPLTVVFEFPASLALGAQLGVGVGGKALGWGRRLSHGFGWGVRGSPINGPEFWYEHLHIPGTSMSW